VSDNNSSQQGRSDGCLALDPSIERSVVDRIHDGSLIYAAISPLAPPVGRAGTGSGSDTPADGEGGGDPVNRGGGCSTGAPSGLVFALALLGVRRRRLIAP
jgi:uncharacterized protein (TIGR03382 family)